MSRFRIKSYKDPIIEYNFPRCEQVSRSSKRSEETVKDLKQVLCSQKRIASLIMTKRNPELSDCTTNNLL